MKTAMQELIEFIDNEVLLNKQYIESPRLRLGAEIAKSKALTLLDKEKQQIIDAADNWVVSEPVNGEQYYNQTYGGAE